MSFWRKLFTTTLPRVSASPALLRLVLDGLTVKTDDVDRTQLDIPAGTEREHRLGLQVGDFPLDARDIHIIRRKPQEPAPQLRRITCARVGADSQVGIPVSFENRGIDSIHRRAAHEPDNPELTCYRHLVRLQHPVPARGPPDGRYPAT
jgi:hypothetical protein